MKNNEYKIELVNDIVKLMGTTSNLEVLMDIKKTLIENKPLFIRDYIDKHWSNHSDGFRDDLEHELRKFWLKLSSSGSGCYKIETNGYLNHFSDLTVRGQPLDIWIMEIGTEFNPCDIAFAIYDIYIGKVVFCK